MIPEAVVDLADHSASRDLYHQTWRAMHRGRNRVRGMKLSGGACPAAGPRLLPGDLYRQSKVEESRDALYKLGLFDSVTFSDATRLGAGTVDVRVKLREGCCTG